MAAWRSSGSRTRGVAPSQAGAPGQPQRLGIRRRDEHPRQGRHPCPRQGIGRGGGEPFTDHGDAALAAGVGEAHPPAGGGVPPGHVQLEPQCLQPLGGPVPHGVPAKGGEEGHPRAGEPGQLHRRHSTAAGGLLHAGAGMQHFPRTGRWGTCSRVTTSTWPTTASGSPGGRGGSASRGQGFDHAGHRSGAVQPGGHGLLERRTQRHLRHSDGLSHLWQLGGPRRSQSGRTDGVRAAAAGP